MNQLSKHFMNQGTPIVNPLRAWAGVIATATGVLLITQVEAAPAKPGLDADHAKKMREGTALFQESIGPALDQHCLRCHGGEKVRSGLNLASRELLLQGGDSGSSIVPGDPSASYLMVLLRHEEEPFMPAKKPKLDAELLAKFERWIELGAPYDKPLIDVAEAGEKKGMTITDTDRAFWSFAPLTDPEPPAVENPKLAPTVIDQFLQAKREELNLAPNPPADSMTILRRAHLTLTGLPPTPQEQEAFKEAYAKNPKAAYESLVDNLLDRPSYGEKWARHWLDVARFAESHGFEQDYDRPHAYHYRDFVIQALNQDMPYDQFVRWQLAGDEDAPEDPLAMMATGFLGAGPFPTQLTEKEFESARYDELDDMAATTGTAFLGLTIGCARCHDHKYDPIPVKDYYEMVSNFTTTIRSEIELETGGEEKTTVQVTSEGFPPTKHHADGRGFPHFYPKTYHLNRGDANQKQEEAQQGFLQVLMRDGKAVDYWQEAAPEDWRTSYRRTSLANWITDVESGAGHLVARVMVNRLWQHQFGHGIVNTPSDFGFQGERPTHPELLDYLAQRLLAHDWKLKPLQKEIMMTAAYQQSSTVNDSNLQADPDNRYLWGFPQRRLEAENLRGSILAVSGALDDTRFGKGSLDAGTPRRSIYLFIKRSQLIPMLQIFDMPEPLVSQGSRPSTTIAPQALLFMNNPNVVKWAGDFAALLESSVGDDVDAAIELGFRRALCRSATPQEIATNREFIAAQAAVYQAADKPNATTLALADFCQILFSLNEFAYIE